MRIFRKGEWLKHSQGNCPINGDVMVMIQYRCGKIVGPVEAKSRRWKRWPSGQSDFDVVAFQLC